LGAPAAAPHILAGATTILTLPGPSNDQENQKEVKKDKIPALIAVVYVCVRTRLSGRKTCQHLPQAALALSTLAKLREDEEGVEWEGWEKVGMKDVDAWLSEILAHGKRDWFQNIVKGAELEVKEAMASLRTTQTRRRKVGMRQSLNVAHPIMDRPKEDTHATLD
jgi:hypothetical protein